MTSKADFTVIPEIPPEYYPADIPKFTYADDFITKFNNLCFNVFPQTKEFTNLAKKAQYLFYCKGLDPKAITEFFLLKKEQTQLLFYEYFSCINLEYVPLLDVLRLLIPRVAFPAEMQYVMMIIDALADAYYNGNTYISEKREDIVLIITVSVLFSFGGAYFAKSPTQFLEKLKSEKSTETYKTSIFTLLKDKPIPVFFTFVDVHQAHDFGKTGILTRIDGKIKRKKKGNYKLSLEAIQCLKNDIPVQDIPLDNVIATYVESSGKEPSHFTLKRTDDAPFGQKFSKNGKKKSSSSLYTFYAASDGEVKEWVNLLNFVTFYASLLSLTNPVSSTTGKVY